MAKKATEKHAADGCPPQSTELDGKIITAATSTMAARSFEKGYPDVPGRLRMENIGGRKK